MQKMMGVIFRIMSFVFGLFDTFGVIWISGLARTWYELLWWSSPAICLMIGALLPEKTLRNDIVSIPMITIGLIGLTYAFYRVDSSLNFEGIDPTDNIIRVGLLVFIIIRMIKSRGQNGAY